MLRLLILSYYGLTDPDEVTYRSNNPPMNNVLAESFIIFLLILLNGYFALAELAIVSSRKTRLQHLAEDGNRNAALALGFAENPATFLSTVQIGITLVGIVAGAYGGANLADHVARLFADIPWLAPYSATVSFILVVAVITYLTLIIGELVPKHIALENPERWACRVAPAMRVLTTITHPVVSFLSVSSQGVLKLLGIAGRRATPVSDEEISMLFEEGVSAGVFDPREQEIVERLFRLSDRCISDMMTPRMEIIWLDADATQEDVARVLRDTPHTAYPVCDGAIDRVLGIVLATDIARAMLEHQPCNLRAQARPPVFQHESVRAFLALEQLKHNPLHQVLVVNEYGEIEGLVTLTDVLESLVGELPEASEEPPVVRREDGSLLVDGQLPVDELRALLDIDAYLPDEEAVRYRTLAGFVLTRLGHVPHTGECFTWDAYRFEVVDMDGNRIDRVLITPHTI